MSDALDLNTLENSGAGRARDLLLSSQPVFEGFVEFTTGLVTNVINTIVESTIDQLEAYAELVANVSGTLADYETRTFPNLEADDGDVIKYINGFIKDGYGTSAWVNVEKDTAADVALDPEKLSAFYAHFSGVVAKYTVQNVTTEFAIKDKVTLTPTAPPHTGAKIDALDLYAFTLAKFKKEMNAGRDNLLAILKLGMQKVVITNGRISTSLVFHTTGSDTDETKSMDTTSSYKVVNANVGGKIAGKLLKRATGSLAGGISGQRSKSALSVRTEQRTASTTLDVTITGGVELNFRTESFPSFDPTTP